MKKILLLALTVIIALSCFGCEKTPDDPKDSDTNKPAESDTNKPAESESSTDDNSQETGDVHTKSDGVMTYAEYEAADLETKVVIEAFVQAKQSYWEKDGQGKATIYTQDADGAYFVYEMNCTKEDYDKMVKGIKIRVTGFKNAWSGEVEITDATYEILEGSYIAEAKDVTSLLGTDDIINSQNQYVSFKGMTVEASKDADGKDVAFLYKWNGSGQEGDDLYFNVSVNGKTYQFLVESYLCDKDTDVYKAVKELKIGDKIDMEGFLYWYDGVNPHIVSVTPSK